MSVRDNTYYLAEDVADAAYRIENLGKDGWSPAEDKMTALRETWDAFYAAFIAAFGEPAGWL